MSETDFAAFEAKTPGDRNVMHVLYGMHTVAPFTLWSLAVIALVVNYLRRTDEGDALYAAHHTYMIKTFWWSILWLLLSSPLWALLVFPGAVAWTLVGAWYLYRCVRGWLRFNDNQPPHVL
jgi:uncharacterized membrane protein